MKTQDNYTPGTQPASQHPAVRPRGKGWLAGFGAIVVIALVIGISVFVSPGESDTSRWPMATCAERLQYNFAGYCKQRPCESVRVRCAYARRCQPDRTGSCSTAA